jgi:Flp pilus assembly protein TadG
MRPSSLSRQWQRGAAAVELALVMVPLLLLVFGVAEFGRAIYQYNTLAKATRDAARYLSAQAPGEGHAQAVCLAVHGNTSCTGTALAPGLTAAQVQICDAINCIASHRAVLTGSGQMNLVTVSIVGFQFVSLFDFTIFGYTVGAPDITYGAISTTMRQES